MRIGPALEASFSCRRSWIGGCSRSVIGLGLQTEAFCYLAEHLEFPPWYPLGGIIPGSVGVAVRLV